MQVTVKHTLPAAEAKKRLDHFAGRLKEQFPNDAQSIQQHWEGETCTVTGKVRGFAVACNLTLADDAVIADGTLPLLARPFQGVIENAVRRGLEQALQSA